MEQYVKINVKESVRTKLKEMAAEKGQTLADFLESVANSTANSTVNIVSEGDRLLEEIDARQSQPQFDDELPECCQGIYSGRSDDRCEHWAFRNGRFYNTLTHRYIDDPIYVNYFQGV